jgi:glutathione synthase
MAATDFDAIVLRSNPADEVGERAWAQSVGLIFGQLAAREGVIVVNDPFALAHATNKLYFQTFPREVRPKTLITRDAAEVKRFFREHDGKVVLKPLQGSGGQSVFLVREGDEANLNQMIDAVIRDGYLVAQEYLPAAAEGDTRLILLNGRPLVAAGKHAAVFRAAQGGDMRSNIHAGGKAQRAKISDRMLAIAEAVRPKLQADGMFLVGLDIAGDKLMEVNVFSPGAVNSMCELEECDFFEPIVASLENKVAHRARYGARLSNAELAVL